MNAFSKIDMGEVTRLTQVGKLAEAMALLQGHTASDIARRSPGSEVPRLTQGIKRPSPPLPTIDMVAPSAPGGAWTAPTQFKQRTAGESVRPVKALEPPDLAHMMQAFRGLPKLGALSTVGDGLGTARQASVHVPEGARFEERTFTNDAGSRTYKVYVPSGYTGQSLPVVVMLHGCTQNPDDFAAGTRMNDVAEEQTFLVAYPRQPQSANMQKCWNWFNAGDQQRESGEPSLIAGIAMQVVEEFSADPTRVYGRVSRLAVQRRRSWRPPILIFLRPSASIRGWLAARPGTCRRPSLLWAGAGRFGGGVKDGGCRPSYSMVMPTGPSTLSTATTSSTRQGKRRR
jgi:hypothetical protein